MKARICMLASLASLTVSVVQAQTQAQQQQQPNVQPPKLVKHVVPYYPLLAQRSGVEGTVRLKILINKEGAVLDPEVVSGDALLIPSALAAVEQWRYEPARHEGQPVDVEISVDLVFSSSKGRTPRDSRNDRERGEASRLAQPGKLVKSEVPAYPSEAKENGIRGTVDLAVLIGADGKVREVEVLAGSPALAGAAQAAVRNWVYEPATLGGKPVEVLARISVAFRL